MTGGDLSDAPSIHTKPSGDVMLAIAPQQHPFGLSYIDNRQLNATVSGATREPI
jgi:hypothetical protein